MEIGTVSEVSFTVSPEMRPVFEETVVHDVLSTAWMITWMEWAARRIILPYLEETEEGIGYEVSVRHVGPAPVGSTVTCRAVLTAVRGREIVTDVSAEGPLGRVGEGRVVQMIISRELFRKRLEAVSRVEVERK